MSYRKKRNTAIYWICLLLYVALLGMASVFALKTVWDFAVLYEQSMPGKVIEGYISQLSSDLWEQGLGETMSAMEHEFQTDEECKAVVMEMLDGEVSYVRTTSSDPSLSAYALRCKGSSFGKVYLAKDETKKATFEVLGKELELPWDLRPWIISKQEFDLTGLYTSVEITVPETYAVQINGKTLDSSYVIEKGIQYDSLKDYYDVNPNLPTKCTYHADKIVGYIEPTVLDEDGQVYVVDVERDDSQYIRECAPEKRAQLDEFCAKFCERYLRFTSGIMGKNSGGGYAELTNYVVQGSDLDMRLQNALDGLSWAHTFSFQVDNYQFVSATELGAGFYVCEVVVNTTTNTQGNGEKQDENKLKIVVQETEQGIMALSLA